MSPVRSLPGGARGLALVASLALDGAARATEPPAVGAPPATIVSEKEAAEREFARLLALQRAAPPPPLATGDGVTAEDVIFKSATLKREMRYRVLLPASYRREHRHYPVLYLLHGYMNPYYEWDRQTDLARLLAPHDLIVVLPQFDNSFYLNSAADPKDRYLSYFFRDLLPDVQARYRARTEPPARAVAGVSMGGYGAMLLALRFPQAFSFAAEFSGCLDLVHDRPLAEAMQPFELDKLLGPPESETRKANDVMALVEMVDPAALPYLWLTAGADDFLFDQTLAFAQALRKRHLLFEFHTAPGDHEWAVWNRELPGMLEAAMERLGSTHLGG